ncbi:hypothetical protein [Lamprocystis purpurea]|nr:hypothetical protein [Lamprocystis purpurea]
MHSQPDSDFYAWATESAARLRDGRVSEAECPFGIEQLLNMEFWAE